MAQMTEDLPIDEIYSDDEFNCRGKIAPIDVVGLAKSIDENGLNAPITVQPWDKIPDKKYRIVAGHRRYKAHQVLKRTTIECVIKVGLTEFQARVINLEENLKRQDLNLIQEARSINHFFIAGMREADIAREIGMSRGWVQVRIMALQLPPEIQNEIIAGFIAQEQIREISSLPSKEKQYQAVKFLKEAKLRGEKRPLITKLKKQKPLQKKKRNEQEIAYMQDVVREAVGNNLTTRFAAWANGVITSFEFYRDLQEHAASIGKDWSIPKEIIEEATLIPAENYK